MATDPLPELLAPFLSAPARAGVFTDFDGTISAVVRDPAAAMPLPGALEVLARLAARYARVAVVSGRPAAFLVDRLGRPPGLVLRGLYGIECADAGGDGIVTLGDLDRWRPTVEDAARAAEAVMPAGAIVERKGVSVTLHYRTAPEAGPEVCALADALAPRFGLEVHAGRMAVELMPPVRIDKGTTIAELAGGLDAVCFMGDDRGDIPAFQVLDGLAAHGIATLKVVVRTVEAPPELLVLGDVLADGPADALRILERLAA
ncbi:MAG TPA: trehalose-phosphatase [Acidimicrobiales bacterium]|nr:trehalose-phosphatase [Acidimicrobiales bacterium]